MVLGIGAADPPAQRRRDSQTAPDHCAICHGTHLLLPSWCLPRQADAVEVVGTALVVHATGQGH